MVEADRLGCQHRLQPLPLGGDRLGFVAVAPPEVWGEYLDRDQWIPCPDGGHGPGEEGGPVVALIVPGDRGEHDVAQTQGGDGLGDALGFLVIDGLGGESLVHLAEGAAAGADRSPQQKRGRSGGVALTAVWAAPLLADGVQPLLLHDGLHRLQFGGIADRRADPFR